MQQITYCGFPPFFDDLEALQEEIKVTIKRACLIFAGIVLPSAGLIIYALLSAGK